MLRFPNTGHGRGQRVFPAALSSWLSAADVHEVVAVPNSQPSTAAGLVPAVSGSMGSQSSTISAWNGAFLRGTRYGFCRNGGHADYGGNEVSEIDVAAESPAWDVLIERTPVEDLLGGSNYYADGRPTSRHTYYGTWYVPQLGRILSFCGWMGFAYNGDPVGGSADVRTTAVDAFDPVAGSWDLGTHGDVTSILGSETAMCMDRSTGDCYAISTDNDIFKWTAATRTCAEVADTATTAGAGSAAVFDHIGGKIDTFGGRSSLVIRSWDTATWTRSVPSPTGPGAAAFTAKAGVQPGWGIAHDTTNNVVYVLTLDAALFRIRLSDYYTEEITPTGLSLVAPTNGAWGRLQYIESMHAVCYAPNWSSPMLIWRAQ